MLLLVVLVTACNSNSDEKKVETVSTLPTKTLSVSDSINQHISKILDSYEGIRDAFIEYDSASVIIKATALDTVLLNFPNTGINDPALSDSVRNFVVKMSNAAKAIPVKPTLTEKKRSFRDLSDAFYGLLTTIQFDQSIIYKQTCPMAFNDNEAASWISRSAEINNPYLGKKHPKYSAGMLHCGEVSDSVAYKK